MLTKLQQQVLNANLTQKAVKRLDEDLERQEGRVKEHYKQMDISAEVFTGKDETILAANQIDYTERKFFIYELVRHFGQGWTSKNKINYLKAVLEEAEKYTPAWRTAKLLKSILEEDRK